MSAIARVRRWRRCHAAVAFVADDARPVFFGGWDRARR